MRKLIKDIFFLTRRSLVSTFRNPFTYITNFATSLFFLFVYSAGLSGIVMLPVFEGVNYLSFILPVVIVSSAIGAAAGGGQNLVDDLENGFFSRLILTPISRFAILAGPLLTGMIQLIFQVLLLVLIAVLMGLEITLSGFLMILALSMGLGFAFTTYSAAIALWTKNAGSVQLGTMVFFPLLFMSSTFVPLEMIESSWLRVVAMINPTTYVFEAMRAVLIPGWGVNYLYNGVLIGVMVTLILAGLLLIKAREIFNG